MPYRRDEWRRRFQQARAEQIRWRYRQRISRKRLKSGSEHDRSRIITQEQLEHAHDSGAYDPVIPGPAARPEDTPGNGGRGSSKPDESWSPSYIPDDPSPTEQSSGQASSSDSGKQQSGTGASQTDDSSDGDHGKAETGAQEVLRDIAEVQDEFGSERLVDGISLDRAHAFSNLEFLRVKQDMERRPLTFKRCFEQAESPRSALEFIYATPPNLADDDLRHLEQAAKEESDIRAGMADGGADKAHVTGFTNSRPILRYEEHLEDKYRFAIEWGEASNETNKAGQLNNVARSVAHIVNYLAEQVYDGDESKALGVFQQHFSQSEFGQLEIHLGSESDPKDRGYGSVPLPYYDAAGNLINTDVEELKKMYLGSAVVIPTIVHEFGHVIDRNINMTGLLEGKEGDGKFHLSKADPKYGAVLDEIILDYVIEGFVAKQFFSQELWADLFMTAVLSGEGFEVESVRGKIYSETGELLENDIAIFKTFNDPDGPIFTCGSDAPCYKRAVEWKNKNIARAVRAFLPKVLLHAQSERARKYQDE